MSDLDPSVPSLIARYLVGVTPLKARNTRRQDALYARILGPILADLTAADITPLVVDEIHQGIGRTAPVLANRLLSFVSQLCDLAERSGLRPANSNPTRAIRMFSESRRTVFLKEQQREPFMNAARDAVRYGECSYSVALLTVLMMLTGLRWSSVRALEWSEVDLDAGMLRLRPRDEDRENKAGDETVVPITDDVVELLRSSPRCGRWVCPNRRTGKPYTNIRKGLRRICARAGVVVTPHMLRHTFGTALAEAGLTQAEIGACMGHRSGATAWRYVHLAGRPARRALMRGAASVRGSA